MKSVIIHLLLAVVTKQIKTKSDAVRVGAEHGCNEGEITNALNIAASKGLLTIGADEVIVLSDGAKHFAKELGQAFDEGVPAPLALLFSAMDNGEVANVLDTVQQD